MYSRTSIALIGLGLGIASLLTACGSSHRHPRPAPTFTVGGTVSGVIGTVVLQNNGGADLSVSANGNFTFATSLQHGATYNVTVATPPGLQTCTVANGSGTANANVSNVAIACADVAPPVLALSL